MQTSHEFMGLQFDRDAISRIAGQIIEQKKTKRDFIYPTRLLTFTDRGELGLKEVGKAFEVDGLIVFDWEEAERRADEAALADRDSTIRTIDGVPALPLNKTAAQQLFGRLNVPMKFASYLEGKEYRDILGDLMRELLVRDDRKFLVRTLNGKVRAVLSDRYRMLDNADLFFCAVEKFQESGAQLWKARLWDDGFEMFGVAPHIAGEVTTDRTFDPGDGWSSRWYGKGGDVHNAAVRIRNSETGQGGLEVKLSIMRRVCANFNVWADGVSQIHAGGRNENEGLILSDETKTKEAELVWSKVKDAITTAFNADKFQAYIDLLNNATKIKIEAPEAAVDNVLKAYEITEDRKAAILANLLGSGDLSKFGLCQAVTAAAHKLDSDGNAEAASRLEEVGGALIQTDDKKFAALVGA